jgi:hypothetical protein
MLSSKRQPRKPLRRGGSNSVTAPAASASDTSLATTVERLAAELKRQQRQIEELRERVNGG